MINKKLKEEMKALRCRVTKLINLNIQKAAQIRFYKHQLESIDKRIQGILKIDKPTGHKTFAYLKHNKKPVFKKKK